MATGVKIALAALGVGGLGVLLATYEPSRPPSAEFSASYRQQSQGKVQFEIPEVYELVNTCILLGGYRQNNHQEQFKLTAYGKEVLECFGKYASHPCIKKFSEKIKTINNNYAVREPSYSYTFDPSGKLSETGPYRGLVSYEQKLLPSLVSDLEDFAKISNFRSFYADHADFYAREKKIFQQLADVPSMWKWLESKFPERVSSYRIICSPLTGGNHRTARGQGGAFMEILMFVSAPEDKKTFSRREQARLMFMVFTEIDHNYVNPSTARVKGVEKAMGDWKKWGGGQTSYRGAEMVWNEYMTWALFTLYSHDRFKGPDAEVGIADLVEKMESRGFGKFRSFNDELLKFYRANHSATGDELTSHMMEWCANQP